MMQRGFDLGPAPRWNGLFWLCCPHVNPGHSLTWQPPGHKVGRCEFCGRLYQFDIMHGHDVNGNPQPNPPKELSSCDG